jgi:hypothetical protein
MSTHKSSSVPSPHVVLALHLLTISSARITSNLAFAGICRDPMKMREYEAEVEHEKGDSKD